MYVYDLVTNIVVIDDRLSDEQTELKKQTEHVIHEFNSHATMKFLIFDNHGVDCFFYSAMAGSYDKWFVRVKYSDIDFIKTTRSKKHYTEWHKLFKNYFKVTTYADGELQFKNIHFDADIFERKQLSDSEKEVTVGDLKKYLSMNDNDEKTMFNVFLMALNNIKPVATDQKLIKTINRGNFYEAAMMCAKLLDVNITNVAFNNKRVIAKTDSHTSDKCYSLYSAVLYVCCNYM